MQKFNPECYLYVRSLNGKEQHSAYGAILTDAEGKELALLAGCLDRNDGKAADLQAVLTALRVAVNLRREKVAICVHEKEFNTNFLDKHHSAPGTETVKLIYLEVQELLSEIRFHRVDKVGNEKLIAVTALAERARAEGESNAT